MTEYKSSLTTCLNETESAHIFYLTEQTDLYIENALNFILDGLQKNEHVLFVENSRLYPRIFERLQQTLTPEQLQDVHYVNNFDFYWHQGNFSPEAILAYFETVTGKLQGDGRKCRTWGHIEWGSQEDIEDKIILYETEIDHTVPESNVISVCAYDAVRVSSSLCERLLHCHSYFMKDASIASVTLHTETKTRS